MSAGMCLALVLGARRTSGYVGQVVDSIVARGDVRLQALIVPQSGARLPSAARPRSSATTQVVASTLLRAEAAMLRAVPRLPAFMREYAQAVRCDTVDLSTRFERTVEVDPARAMPSLTDVDVVLVVGSWTPPGLVSASGDAVVLQLVPGGFEDPDGVLTGFAEACAGVDRTPVRLWRLLSDDGRRSCLVDGLTRTRPLFSLNQAALWGRAHSIVHAALGDCATKRFGPTTSESVSASVEPATPVTLGSVLGYPLRTAARVLRLAAARRRGSKRWHVGFGPTGSISGETFAVPIAPPGLWWADPLLFRHPVTGAVHCFVEEFDEALGRAHVAVLERSDAGWRRLGVALKEPFHLSFPFVFGYRGEVYMCPETCGARGIFVYRCEEYPLRWARVATLMTGVSATDTVLFPHGDRWWMLANIDRAPIPDHQSELHVFHADSPLSGAWHPIPGNPIKVDSHGARNGGLVIDAAGIHRMGQVQSFESYGRQMNVYRIVRLDELGYEEVLEHRVEVPGDAGVIGFHTYSAIDGLATVDFTCREEPPPVRAVERLLAAFRTAGAIRHRGQAGTVQPPDDRSSSAP
jgi:hypothetical protein